MSRLSMKLKSSHVGCHKSHYGLPVKLKWSWGFVCLFLYCLSFFINSHQAGSFCILLNFLVLISRTTSSFFTGQMINTSTDTKWYSIRLTHTKKFEFDSWLDHLLVVEIPSNQCLHWLGPSHWFFIFFIKFRNICRTHLKLHHLHNHIDLKGII